MRRLPLWLVCLSLVAAVFAGCSGEDPNPASQPDRPSESESEKEQAETEEDPITDVQAILDGLHRAGESSADIIAEVMAVSEEVGYPDPTMEQYERMLDRVAGTHVPAFTQDFDTRNYEMILDFWEAYRSGGDCEITVYEIYNFAIYSNTVTVKDGKLYNTLGYIQYSDLNSPGTDPIQEIDQMEYTESGHLIWHMPGKDGTDGYWEGVRVQPQGEYYLDLLRTYVQPTWMTPNLNTENWSPEDYSALNWDYVFERLIYQETGKPLRTWLGETYGEDAAEYNPDQAFLIPAAAVEPILQKYFPVTTQTLHSIKPYNAAEDAYAFEGFQGGGYSPSPELDGVEENADGSLTLTVNAVALTWGEPQSFQCRLTVLPDGAGGFQYLSNEFLGYQGD